MSTSLEEIEAREKAAREMVRCLCKRRDEPGSREWIMSIPARPDHDPDLVIAASLGDVPWLTARVRELEESRTRIHEELIARNNEAERLKARVAELEAKLEKEFVRAEMEMMEAEKLRARVAELESWKREIVEPCEREMNTSIVLLTKERDALKARVAELENQVIEITTLMKCARCDNGERPRYMTDGLCSRCAGSELVQLREWQAKAVSLLSKVTHANFGGNLTDGDADVSEQLLKEVP